MMNVIEPIGAVLVRKYHHLRNNFEIVTLKVEKLGVLESIIEFTLTPAAYLFTGKTIHQIQSMNSKTNESSCLLKQTYHYRDSFFILKTVAAILALPLSLLIGLPSKCLLQMNPTIKARNQELMRKIKEIKPNHALYEKWGVFAASGEKNVLRSQGCDRPPLTPHQQIQVKALEAVTKALTKHEIPHWIDCGTALGAYRHGGMIPWDTDVDFSILEVDHQNAYNSLRQSLDPNQYEVFDWSSFDHPQTYIRIYIREIDSSIDLYHYRVNEHEGEARYFFSYRDSKFMPEADKKREYACEKPLKLKTLFPLQIAQFDGVSVPVPNDAETFLKSKYGERLDPARIWNKMTQEFEKIEGHPYWKQSHF